MTQPRTFEGTWEKLQSKTTRFKGKRVRVTLLPAVSSAPVSAPKKRKVRIPKCVDKATEDFLREFAGCWAGDDLDECMEQVIRTRSETKW